MLCSSVSLCTLSIFVYCFYTASNEISNDEEDSFNFCLLFRGCRRSDVANRTADDFQFLSIVSEGIESVLHKIAQLTFNFCLLFPQIKDC